MLTTTPGLVSREIAHRLGLERAAVNEVLNQGRGEVFQQDATYRWRMVTPAATDGGEVCHRDEPRGGLLARLCEYYLACLSHDNRNLSYHMQSDRFVELPALPDGERLEVSPEIEELVDSGRRETRSFDLVLGYPLLLRRIRSGFRVEPVLLLHVEALDEASDILRVVNDSLYVNPGAVEHLSDCDRDALSREVAHLETELGLNGDSELLLDEVIARLKAHRQGWPWVDACSPTLVGADPPLLSLTEPGIHSRAIIALSERSSFTQGLESELTALSKLSLDQVRGTALGDWLEGATAPISADEEGEHLLDVPPVNDEQSAAVQRALRDKLTVVTGPPGTGKSQLVSNLLINSAWRNSSVLLSSKNNKAVDVVENRVNGLGVRPVVLRTGAGGYQRKLAADLVSMLTSSTSVDDRERYASAIVTLEELRREKAEAWRQIEDLVALRNRVDDLERDTERARGLAWTERLETREVRKRVDRAHLCLQSLATIPRNPVLRVFARILLWPGRLSRFRTAVERLEELPLSSAAPGEVSEESLQDWGRYLSRLSEDLEQAELLAQYRQALEILNRTPLDQLQLRYAELTKQLRDQSGEVWKIWTGTLSDRLDAEARRTLGGQISYLRMIGDADTELSGELYGVFREICVNALRTFPVWASTALSARNRLPLEPGLFDLVVIDEASQCEIASALPLLYRARRAVIIGDPNQLQHISGIPRSADFQAMRRYGVGAELPSWSYSVNSLFDLANSLAATESLVNLVDHHRSHPAIIGFSDEAFYDGKLRVLTRPGSLNMPRTRAGVTDRAVRWIGCSGKAARAPGGGAENRLEAEKVCETLRS